MKKYQSAKKTYDEYKRLRKHLGKPSKAFDDKDAILKDLLGDGFLELQKEIGKYERQKPQTINS